MSSLQNPVDEEYFRLLRTILEKGRRKKNRTGVDTIGVFGEQAKFQVDLNAFPILTTKKVWFKGIVHELLWFIRGDTNIEYLVDNDVHIWDAWAFQQYKQNYHDPTMSQDEFINYIKTNPDFAREYGDLGRGTYGGMWRDFPVDDMDYRRGNHILGVDQLDSVVETLKTNPDNRRMIVSSWHPHWSYRCALAPCHCFFHFNTEELTPEERDQLATEEQRQQASAAAMDAYDKTGTYSDELSNAKIPTRRLNLLLYQRSGDAALGIPYNITSYSLLLAMVSQCVNMVPGIFTHTYGDLHIYETHLDGVKEQLSRSPRMLPKLWLNPKIADIFSFKYEDIKLNGYDPCPKIPFEVAV